MRHRFSGPVIASLAILALAGCASGTASGAPDGASAGSSATAAPIEPSAAAAPSDAPSLVVPSFAFPNDDKELEALLPDEICGETVAKFSFGGDLFAEDPDPAFLAVLQQLGKTTDDVSFAVASEPSGESGCAAGIFRVKGADSGRLQELFLAELAKEGSTYTETSLGGRTVFVDPEADDFQYAFFKGDAVLYVTAPDDTTAASIIATMP